MGHCRAGSIGVVFPLDLTSPQFGGDIEAKIWSGLRDGNARAFQQNLHPFPFFIRQNERAFEPEILTTDLIAGVREGRRYL